MSKIGYQESAVAELVKKTIHIFENDNPGKTFLLQSCTGSGKTVMRRSYTEAEKRFIIKAIDERNHTNFSEGLDQVFKDAYPDRKSVV